MRRLVLLIALSNCTNPDEILPVRGLVASPDPVAGQVVRLQRHTQLVNPEDYVPCQPSAATRFKETSADADGNYRFDVFRVEAQSLTGFERHCFRVDASFASGSTASSEFEDIRFETAVAPLRDWRAEPRLEEGVLVFAPPIPLPDDFALGATPGDPSFMSKPQLNHRAQVVSDEGQVVWQVDDRFRDPSSTRLFREPMVIDGVRLEDFGGSVVLRANLRLPDRVPYGLGMVTPPPVGLVSGTRLAVSGSLTPVSRGLPCPPFAAPCPLTDGDLTAVDGQSVKDVSLALPAPRSLSAIVMRGLEAGDANVGVRLTLDDGGVAALSGYIPTNSAFDESLMVPPMVLPDGGFSTSKPAYVVIPVDAGVVVGLSLHFPEGLRRIQELSLFE